MNYELVNNAVLFGMQLVMRRAMLSAAAARGRVGKPTLIITCGTNGAHTAGSLHPYGYAIDIRTRDIAPDSLDTFYGVLRADLTPFGFSVVRHPTHCHIEYRAALVEA